MKVHFLRQCWKVLSVDDASLSLKDRLIHQYHPIQRGGGEGPDGGGRVPRTRFPGAAGGPEAGGGAGWGGAPGCCTCPRRERGRGAPEDVPEAAARATHHHAGEALRRVNPFHLKSIILNLLPCVSHHNTLPIPFITPSPPVLRAAAVGVQADHLRGEGDQPPGGAEDLPAADAPAHPTRRSQAPRSDDEGMSTRT